MTKVVVVCGVLCVARSDPPARLPAGSFQNRHTLCVPVLAGVPQRQAGDALCLAWVGGVLDMGHAL